MSSFAVAVTRVARRMLAPCRMCRGATHVLRPLVLATWAFPR